MSNELSPPHEPERVSLATIAREWTRLGCISFGGPATQILLLRRLCVEERHWIEPKEFEDGIAATNLLPGPAATQLAIFCAWRVRRIPGAILGGICLIVPSLVLILALAAVFLAKHPASWVLGAAAGAGAAVPAVALSAAWRLVPTSRSRIGSKQAQKVRWIAYALVGGVAAAIVGPYLVLALLSCGVAEVMTRRQGLQTSPGSLRAIIPATVVHMGMVGGLGAVAWVAFKIGALSYGGGFVIVPLMQHDAVTTYHWMTAAQFLNAVALGQVTPGPVVQTIAVVGYAAAGVVGGLFAAFIAFAPSFLFVLFGAPRFDQIRANASIQSFLTGAGPAVIGAIAGSAIPLGLALQHLWQIPVLAGALLWLLIIRRGVVSCLLIAGVIGVALALSGVHV
jgi:chromate transporter